MKKRHYCFMLIAAVFLCFGCNISSYDDSAIKKTLDELNEKDKKQDENDKKQDEKIKELESRISTLEKLLTNYSQLSETISSINSSFSIFSVTINNLNDKYNELSSEVTKISSSTDSEKITSLQEEIIQLQNRVSDIENTISNYEQLKELITKFNNFETITMEQEQAVESLKILFNKELSDLDDKITEVNNTLSSYTTKDEFTKINNSISDLSESIENITEVLSFNYITHSNYYEITFWKDNAPVVTIDPTMTVGATFYHWETGMTMIKENSVYTRYTYLFEINTRRGYSGSSTIDQGSIYYIPQSDEYIIQNNSQGTYYKSESWTSCRDEEVLAFIENYKNNS